MTDLHEEYRDLDEQRADLWFTTLKDSYESPIALPDDHEYWQLVRKINELKKQLRASGQL